MAWVSGWPQLVRGKTYQKLFLFPFPKPATAKHPAKPPNQATQQPKPAGNIDSISCSEKEAQPQPLNRSQSHKKEATTRKQELLSFFLLGWPGCPGKIVLLLICQMFWPRYTQSSHPIQRPRKPRPLKGHLFGCCRKLLLSFGWEYGAWLGVSWLRYRQIIS